MTGKVKRAAPFESAADATAGAGAAAATRSVVVIGCGVGQSMGHIAFVTAKRIRWPGENTQLVLHILYAPAHRRIHTA
jgi:hypothetical protein